MPSFELEWESKLGSSELNLELPSIELKSDMMTRNRSMSTWFHKKSTEEQKKLLPLSAQKSSELRLKHRQKEQAVRAKWKEKVKIRGQEIEKKHLKETERKAKITSTVKEKEVPCTKPSDADTLLKRFHTLIASRKAIDDERSGNI